MDVYKKHIELLGLSAKDKVTGFKGVIDSVTFDLHGCIQASLKPPIDEDGRIPGAYWVDVTRLEVSKERIIDPPNFAEGYKGPSDKPSRQTKSACLTSHYELENQYDKASRRNRENQSE